MKNAPAYIKIYNRLKNEIQKGTYPVGGFLPKEYELEEIYQVSRTTIRNAVKILAKEGMVRGVEPECWITRPSRITIRSRP